MNTHWDADSAVKGLVDHSDEATSSSSLVAGGLGRAVWPGPAVTLWREYGVSGRMSKLVVHAFRRQAFIKRTGCGGHGYLYS
jgi:hypothetical protein